MFPYIRDHVDQIITIPDTELVEDVYKRQMLEDALREVVARTFNRVTVDGDTSTNDMCVVLANGMAENELIEWKDDNYTVFYKTLYYVFEQLARSIAADGEGRCV